MRSLFMAIFLLVLAQPAAAVYLLSMEEAEKMFFENNLEIKAKKADVEKSDAEVVDARILPNPQAAYNIQSVKNSGTEREETYSLSQRIDISGKRSKKMEAAMKKRDARALFVEHDTAGLLSQMKQSFYKVLFLKENEKALSEIAGVFSDVERKTEARVSAGDASEADLMKLVGEKNKIVRGREALRADLKSEKRKLALLLNIQEPELEVSGEFSVKPLSSGILELTGMRQQNRPDIKGQGKTVEASEVSLSASKKEAIPTIDLEAGYKKRTGGFNGFVFGISVPLPLFDRNQGGIARAQAELQQEKIIFEAMKKAAAYEANLLFDRIASLQARVEDLSRQLEMSRELTRIAGIAYEEGETGLLDLLDAVRSEKELVVENNTAVYDYWAARFELEKNIGAKVTPMGGTK